MEEKSQFQYLDDNGPSCLLLHQQGVACVLLHFHIPQGVGVCLVLVTAGLDVPYISYTCDEPLSMSAVCMLYINHEVYQRYSNKHTQKLKGNRGNISHITE